MKQHKLFVADHMTSDVLEKLASSDEAEKVFANVEEMLANDLFDNPGLRISIVDGVAIISASGVLIPGEEIFPSFFGIVSYGSVASAVETVSRMEDVGAIVLDLDSPGGTVVGSIEASRRISAVAENTTVVAHTSSGAFSGAFMLASATGTIKLSETAGVGSIGVRLIHENISGMLEQDGIEITELFIGKQKTLGSPFRPLSDEDKEILMQSLRESFDSFVDIVHEGIGLSKEAIIKTEAGIFVGKSAVKAGLADEVITLNALVEQLSGTFSDTQESETDLQNLITEQEGNMSQETSEAQAEAAAPEQKADVEGQESPATYIEEVMVKLESLGRLDAMPSIVEQKVALGDIESELSYESDVKALCKVANVSDDADTFLSAKMPINQIKSALFDKMIANAEATSIDSSRADAAPEQKAPALMSVTDIFNSRKTDNAKKRTK